MTQRFKYRSSTDPTIWIVAPFPPPYGGMSLQAEKLAQRLAGEGLSVEIIPTNPRPPSLLRYVEGVAGVRTLVREIQYLLSLRSALRGPGIVHHLSASYLFFFLHTLPLLLFSKWSGTKLLLNYRGGKANDFLRQVSWLVAPLLRAANVVAVPSEYLRQVFKRYGVASIVLPNIADVEGFSFKERKQLSAKFLVCRHLEPMYDIECVLRSFRRIQESVPQAALGIAGDGCEKQRLQGLVHDWNLRNVDFYGVVPYRDLPSLYDRHDIYLNGSRVDNFPGALVEAACAGLPIVSTRAGGIAEMIRHGENGLLVAVGDDDALASSALELLQKPELGRELASRARSWVEQFSWGEVFPQLLRAYGIQMEEEPASVLVH